METESLIAFSKRNVIIKENSIQYYNALRGEGFLLGIKLYGDQKRFIKLLMDNKLLTIKASENVVRVLPPLNVKKKELDIALKIIDKVCSKFN